MRRDSLLAVLAVLLRRAPAKSLYEDPLARPYFEVDFGGRPIGTLQADILQTEGEGRQRRDLKHAASSHAASTHAGDTHSDGDESETEIVKYKLLNDGKKRYLCAVPVVAAPAVDDEDDGVEADSENDRLRIAQAQEAETTRATERGLELLKGLEGTCFYWMAGFWSYRFCYSDGITQFHALPPSLGRPLYPPAEDPDVPTFELGRKRKTTTLSGKRDPAYDARGPFGTPGSEDSKSLVVEYDGGTYCPLIGAQRKTEVQFQCSPATNDRIGFVKEISTCQYLIVVQTPRLCSDLAFAADDPEPVHMIRCRPISDEPEVPAIDDSSQAAASALPAAQEGQEEAANGQAARQGDDQPDAVMPPPASTTAKPDPRIELERIFEAMEEEAARLIEEHRAAAANTDRQSEADRRTRAAEALVEDLAQQLDAGTLVIDGRPIRKDDTVEYDFELHDDDGNVLGEAVMNVVDGDVVVELYDFDTVPKKDRQQEQQEQEQQEQAEGDGAHGDVTNGGRRQRTASSKRTFNAAAAGAAKLKTQAMRKAQAKKNREQMPPQLRDTLRQFVHDEM